MRDGPGDYNLLHEAGSRTVPHQEADAVMAANMWRMCNWVWGAL